MSTYRCVDAPMYLCTYACMCGHFARDTERVRIVVAGHCCVRSVSDMPGPHLHLPPRTTCPSTLAARRPVAGASRRGGPATTSEGRRRHPQGRHGDDRGAHVREPGAPREVVRGLGRWHARRALLPRAPARTAGSCRGRSTGELRGLRVRMRKRMHAYAQAFARIRMRAHTHRGERV